jgi:hypothetical protein
LVVYDKVTQRKSAVVTQLEFGQGQPTSGSEVVVAGVETLAPALGGGCEVYTGSFNAKGERHGDGGVCVYADGSSYQGAWRSGQRNGKGVFEDAVTKERYDGKWVGGFRCGRGLCTYPAGHRYEGQWAKGLREGSGTFFKADGECYSGEWAGGRRHGHGVRTDARGRVVKGSWKLGELIDTEDEDATVPIEADAAAPGPRKVEASRTAPKQRWGASSSETNAANSEDENGLGPEDNDGADTVASLVSLEAASLATGTSHEFNAETSFLG